jgi:hypothetical protein
MKTKPKRITYGVGFIIRHNLKIFTDLFLTILGKKYRGQFGIFCVVKLLNWEKYLKPFETSFMPFWHSILICAKLFIPANANIIQSIENTLNFDDEMCENICLISYWNELSFDIENFSSIVIQLGFSLKIWKKISIFAIGNGFGNLTSGATEKSHDLTENKVFSNKYIYIFRHTCDLTKSL